MSYNKMVSITGLSGLFELVSSKADGGIVRSLEDKSVKFVSNRVHSFSHLESIEVFTVNDNVNLSEIFLAMQASKEKMPDTADVKAIKAYFTKVYPDMDLERVYASDMKKMIKWYDILNKAGVEIKLTEQAEGEESTEVEDKPVVEKKVKAAAPKAAAIKNNAPAKKINTPRKMA
jgi:hypothetical protein